MKICKFFNLVMAFVLAFSFLGIPAPVSAQEHFPSIQVWISGRVDGLNWPENNQITLRIENPSLPESPTFHATLPTFPCWWDGNQGCVNIDMGSFQFVVGQVLTMSDQNDNVREYTVTSLSLKIIEIDPGTDTISGMADPNSTLSVNIGNILNAPNRIVTADTFGRWTAYFSDVGTGEPTFDITPGTGIWVSQQDNDGDGISDYAMVPALMVKANFDTDEIQAWGLENGTPISLSINDPDNGPGVDYSEILNIAPTDWDPNQYLAQFRPENFDVQPGQIITVSGGGQIKTMTVANIWGISIDVDADTVSGYIAAGSSARVHVGENLDSGNLFVDENGYWIADLSLVGTDIKPGSKGYVQVDTQDGGTTWIGFQVFNPSFTALFPWNRIDAYRWPMDADLALTIDDPDNGTGADYTETTTVGLENFNPPSDTWASFRVDGFELQPGQLITVTDGETIKTHVVQYVTVTEVNPETDTIVGTATPGTEVQIGRMCDESGCAYRSIVANAEGNWLADLTSIGNVGGTQGVFDIGPGSKSDAFIADDNDDRTSYQWEVPSIPNPAFSVVPNDPNSGPRNIIMGWDWEAGTTVTLCIENPPFDLACDYTDLLIVPTEPNGFAGYQFEFSVDPSIFRITAGQRVQLDNGLHTEQHIVTNMRLLWVDWDTDTVGGTADPDSVIGVPAVGDNQYVNRRVTANSEGEWSADFAHPGSGPDENNTLDLLLGHVFFIPEQVDENGNSTKFWWQPPNPKFDVRANNDQVEVWEWKIGDILTLTIDNPNTADNPDYTAQKTVTGPAPWGDSRNYVSFDLSGTYDVQTGDTVSISNGSVTKTTVVTDLAFTDINIDTDTVSGIAPAGSQVDIWACDNSNCYNRHVTASDPGGIWVANWHIQGPQDDEKNTFDLIPGTWVDSSQYDDDGDSTMFGQSVLNYTLHANIKDNEVHGHDWPEGDVVTLIIDNDINPNNGVLYQTTKNAYDDPWCGYPCFDLQSVFDLQVGQYVTMTDGQVSKTVHVSVLTVTEVNAENETLSGNADPGSRVMVNIWSQNGIARAVTTDENGHWLVDFSVPGDEDFEQETTDITTADNGRAIQLKPDGTDDGTLEYWYINTNNPPEADAGPDHIVFAGNLFTLDASASADPEAGALIYEWDLDNDGQYDDASGVSISTSFNQIGEHTIGLRVTDSVGLSDIDTATVIVLPWTLKGFYQPVDMNGVYNLVKGGSTVPLKFEIFAGSTELTNIADIKSLTYAQTACNANAITDDIETTATGGTILRYDTFGGQFIFNWKTPTTAGKCYRVTLTAIDNSTLVAYFKLK